MNIFKQTICKLLNLALNTYVLFLEGDTGSRDVPLGKIEFRKQNMRNATT